MTQRDSGSRRSNLIRVNERDLEMLLNRLDASPSDRKASRRAHKRFPFRVKSCSVAMQQPGDSSPALFAVHTRNLSASGISFLHGGFVHVGTKVTVQLISTHGSWSDVDGEVVSCRYLQDGVHEVSCRFAKEIQPSDFCSAALTYHILLVDDDEAVARLASHHLGMLNAEVERARNGKEGVEMALSGRFDCVLMDMEMPVMNGWEAAEALRAKGYSGLIIAMTAMTRPEDHERCLKAGCNRFIAKPVAPGVYSDLVRSLAEEPLVSIYQDDPNMRDLIIDFVESLPGEIRRIEEAMMEETLEPLEVAVRAMKGTSGGYGFDTISSAAAKVEQSCQSHEERAVVKKKLEELLRLCMSARAPERPKSPQ